MCPTVLYFDAEMRNMSKYKYYVYFVLSMIIFGTNGLLVANISLSSAEIVLMRTLFGSVFLLIIVAVTRSFSFADLKKDLIPASLGGVALGLNWVLLFTAYREAGVSLSTLVYYCGPILVLAFSPLLFREKLTLNKIAALIALFLAGCLLIVGLTHAGHHVPSRESALVSTDGSPCEREVSGFLFLGLFKECMRRGRKEDEKKERK